MLSRWLPVKMEHYVFPTVMSPVSIVPNSRGRYHSGVGMGKTTVEHPFPGQGAGETVA